MWAEMAAQAPWWALRLDSLAPCLALAFTTLMALQSDLSPGDSGWGALWQESCQGCCVLLHVMAGRSSPGCHLVTQSGTSRGFSPEGPALPWG